MCTLRLLLDVAVRLSPLLAFALLAQPPLQINAWCAGGAEPLAQGSVGASLLLHALQPHSSQRHCCTSSATPLVPAHPTHMCIPARLNRAGLLRLCSLCLPSEQVCAAEPAAGGDHRARAGPAGLFRCSAARRHPRLAHRPARCPADVQVGWVRGGQLGWECLRNGPTKMLMYRWAGYEGACSWGGCTRVGKPLELVAASFL